jgi:hypothetical protein
MPTKIAASSPVPNEAFETKTTKNSEIEYPQISDVSEIKKDLSIMKRDKRFAPFLIPIFASLFATGTVMAGGHIADAVADSSGSSSEESVESIIPWNPPKYHPTTTPRPGFPVYYSTTTSRPRTPAWWEPIRTTESTRHYPWMSHTTPKPPTYYSTTTSRPRTPAWWEPIQTTESRPLTWKSSHEPPDVITSGIATGLAPGIGKGLFTGVGTGIGVNAGVVGAEVVGAGNIFGSTSSNSGSSRPWSPSSNAGSSRSPSPMNVDDRSLNVPEIQQLTANGCGPAIGESILRYFKYFNTNSPIFQSELSNLMNTIESTGGTTPINWMNGMNSAMESLGISLGGEYSITEFTGQFASTMNDFTRFNNIVRTSLEHNVPVAFAFSGSETFMSSHHNHFIVIDGVNNVPGTGPVYRFMDPWTGTRGTMDEVDIFTARISDSTRKPTSNQSPSYLIAYTPQTPSSSAGSSRSLSPMNIDYGTLKTSRRLPSISSNSMQALKYPSGEGSAAGFGSISSGLSRFQPLSSSSGGSSSTDESTASINSLQQPPSSFAGPSRPYYLPSRPYYIP